MELNQQIFKAPSIPKIRKTTISSSVFARSTNAINSTVKLNKTTFSFIQPIISISPENLSPNKSPENSLFNKPVSKLKNSLGLFITKKLGETNRILENIQKYIASDYSNRIAEEKKALALEKKKIAAQKVADKESNLEKGSKGILGKTFDKVVAPFKSIFQKLIDFFSIILTGILLNTAFKWLSDKNNQKKLAEFFGFLKEYWQELLIVFGIYKLIRLVSKLFKIAKGFKSLIDFLGLLGKGKSKLPCNCPPKGGSGSSGSGNICKEVFDCVNGKVSEFVKIFTPYFEPTTIPITPPVSGPVRPPVPVSPLFPVPGLNPTQQPQPAPIQPPINPLTLPTQTPTLPSRPNTPNRPNQTPWYNTPLAQGLGYGALGLGLGTLAFLALVSPFEGPAGDYLAGSSALGAFGRSGAAFRTLTGGARTIPKIAPKGTRITSDGRQTESQLVKRIIDLYKKERGIEIRANSLDDLADIFGTTTDSLVKGFSRKGSEGLPELIGRSKGGTVGKGDRPGTDTVPAFTRFGKIMLDAGEEVVRTSSAMLFRPLLKDINDNAGRLWQAFSGATQKQNVNNIIQSDLNKRFNELIKQFKDLIDGEIKRISKNKNQGRPPGGSGGGIRPVISSSGSPVSKPSGGSGGGIRPVISSSGSPVSKPSGGSGGGIRPVISSSGSPVSKPSGDEEGPLIPQKNNISKINLQEPSQNILNNYPTQNITNSYSTNIIPPHLNSKENNIVIVPLPVRNLKNPNQQPKINVINLPTKTVNLAPKPGSIKTPSSGSATEVPSISSFDSSNPYISYSRSVYGMIM